MIIAGEISGDQHAADLIEELKKLQPQWQFEGIGGEELKAHGVKLHYHLSQLAVLGFAEIIKHLPFIRKVLKHLREELSKGIDAVILVDYPGFNLRVAKIAKALGIPVIYYISPQLWAWGEKRVEKMRQHVDLLLVLFQFEVDFYKKHNIVAEFVGHPLVEQIDVQATEAEFREKHQLPADKPIIGILPGSREMEVRELLPIMITIARNIGEKHDALPVIGKAGQLAESIYDPILKENADIPVIDQDTHGLMKYAYAAMVASGTATLEAGYLQTPMAVLYKVSPFTYHLGKILIKIKNIALVNIVCGKTVVPEFIQKDITIPGISSALDRYFSDKNHYNTIKTELAAVKEALGGKGASARTAEKINIFLSKQGRSSDSEDL